MSDVALEKYFIMQKAHESVPELWNIQKSMIKRSSEPNDACFEKPQTTTL